MLRHDPILRQLDSIATMDALLDLSDPTNPREAEWPAAELIVGNPPFLGDKLMIANLGEDYTEALRSVFGDRLPGMSDLCAYWHEKVRALIAAKRLKRAGLLATQAIRHGASRVVLDRINESGGIFFAYADEPWVLAGAAVHISFIGQDDGTDTERTLNGHPVPGINANLTAGLDLTRARRLRENLGIAFQGPVKHQPYPTAGSPSSLVMTTTPSVSCTVVHTRSGRSLSVRASRAARVTSPTQDSRHSRSRAPTRSSRRPSRRPPATSIACAKVG
jgi:hypothetical protein